MNIIQVNNCDFEGRRFNGYDLHIALKDMGHNAFQVVLEKSGSVSAAIPLASSQELFIRSVLKNLEYQLSVNNLLYPFGKMLMENPIFQNADIIHYHLIHNHFISILDLAKLTSLKPSVWTIHDPWAVTGHCVHPLECPGWKNGCFDCPKLDDIAFPMKVDKSHQMWKIKKKVYMDMDVDIVVASKFMEDYIRNSPLTAHFRNISKIPFGIDVNKFSNTDKHKARRYFNIDDKSFVIAFRADSNEIKGLKYIIEMLNKLNVESNITLLTVGTTSLPINITEKYRVIELGWQNDFNVLRDFYAACDVFLMPSLAESFGMMAIEAMAAGRPVIVFENTVLPEITFASECGIAVLYKSSDALKSTVERLIRNPDECRIRGEKGRELAEKHYRNENYVNSHIALYKEILERRKYKL